MAIKKNRKKWPLILFLHGGGQWGENLEDLERVRAPGQLPSVVEQLTDSLLLLLLRNFLERLFGRLIVSMRCWMRLCQNLL